MTTQTVSAAVATRDRSDQLLTWIRKQQADIAMAAASHVKPSAIIRVTQGALRRDDKLLAAAIANPQSLLYALLDCARLGHEPDTDDYYLVPFGQEVTGIEGYKGIIERMFRAGGVTSVVAQVVRQRDRYAPRGENTPPLHEYDDFAPADERGPMRGAYAYAIFTSGHCSQVIRMGRAEIMEHKAASRGSNRSDSPWQQWEPAMWKKTVLRGLEPYVPTSNEFRTGNGMPPAAAEPAVFHRIEHDGTSSSAEIVEAEIVEDPPHSNGAARQEPRGHAASRGRFTEEQDPAVLETPKPAARTGRRRTAAAGDSTRSQRGDQAPRHAEENGADPAPAAAGDAPPRDAQHLPPLPGEDEPPDPTRPAPPAAMSTATASSTAPGADGRSDGLEPGEAAEYGTERHRKMVGLVWQHLGRLGYPGEKKETDQDKTRRLADVARLAGVAEIGSTSDLDLGELTAVIDTLARCKNAEALQALLKTGEVND